MAYPLALAATWLVFLLAILYYSRKSQASVFHPFTFFLIYHFILYVLRPTIVYIFDYRLLYDVYHFTPSLSDKLTVLLSVNLSLLTFAVASLSFGNGSYAELSKKPRFIENRSKYFWPMIVCWALIAPIAIYSLIYTIRWSTVGTFNMVFDKDAGTYINTTGNGYLTDAKTLLVPLVVATAWIGRYNWKYLLPLAAFVTFQSFTGLRWPIVVSLFAIMLLYLYDSRVRWFKMVFVMPLFALWLLFSVLSLDRGSYFRQAVGLSSGDIYSNRIQENKLRFLESMDYGNLEFFELVVYAVPQRTGSYDYFAEQLQVLTEPIPRVLWKDKPKGAPVKFFRLDDYIPVFSFTKSVAGAGWYGLGYFGVVLWSGFFGIVYGLAYSKFRRARTEIAVLAYFIFLALAMQLLRDGLLVSMVKMGGFTILPIFLMRFFSKVLTSLKQVNDEAPHINAPAGVHTLPPAVQRRRAALQAAKPQQA